MSKKPTRRGHKVSPKSNNPSILNRRASFDYELSDDLVVGLELTGLEVKAARQGRVQLKGSYVVPKENPKTRRVELFLINASFSLANNVGKRSGQATTTVDARSRKILARRRQIDELTVARNGGRTIIPTKLLTSGKYIKLVIALGKGKKTYDKRESIKRKDLVRENARFLKRI
jgi:SsrA-binding protein